MHTRTAIRHKPLQQDSIRRRLGRCLEPIDMSVPARNRNLGDQSKHSCSCPPGIESLVSQRFAKRQSRKKGIEGEPHWSCFLGASVVEMEAKARRSCSPAQSTPPNHPWSSHFARLTMIDLQRTNSPRRISRPRRRPFFSHLRQVVVEVFVVSSYLASRVFRLQDSTWHVLGDCKATGALEKGLAPKRWR